MTIDRSLMVILVAVSGVSSVQNGNTQHPDAARIFVPIQPRSHYLSIAIVPRVDRERSQPPKRGFPYGESV